MSSLLFAAALKDNNATWGWWDATACKIATGFIAHASIWNSGRRRRAAVSNCACMRLESATRISTLDEASATAAIVSLSPPQRFPAQESGDDAIVGTVGAHSQGNMSQMLA